MNPDILLAKARQGGGGGAVTYATWNPLDIHANFSLSNGNLTATKIASGFNCARSTIGKTSGQATFEFNFTYSNNYTNIAIGSLDHSLTIQPITSIYCAAENCKNGRFSLFGLTTYIQLTISATSTGQFLGFHIDFDNNQISIYENGIATAENPFLLSNTATQGFPYNGPELFIIGHAYYNTEELTINTGQTDFQYPILGANDGWYE